MGPHSFKCGKRTNELVHRLLCGASMGPHSFKCGKLESISCGQTEESALQWGRTLSSAERNGKSSKENGKTFRFNGAALFQVRKGYRWASGDCAGLGASMGPHSFKCGKNNGAPAVADPTFWSFNGAALFQVRKVTEEVFVPARPDAASMGPHSFKCGKARRR